MRDCRKEKNGSINIDENDLRVKTIVLEIGAGSGKFAFNCVERLLELQENFLYDSHDENMNSDKKCLEKSKNSFLYVMTDSSAKIVNFWLQHEPLVNLMKKGVLEVAVLDASRMTNESDIGKLKLLYSNTTLEDFQNLTLKGERKGEKLPIVCICNYVFDSLQQEVFRINKGDPNSLFRAKCRVSFNTMSTGRTCGNNSNNKNNHDEKEKEKVLKLFWKYDKVEVDKLNLFKYRYSYCIILCSNVILQQLMNAFFNK